MLLNETDLKALVPVAKSFTYSHIAPDIRRTELRLIKPILGNTLYLALAAAYAGESLSAEQTELMEFLQPAIGNLSTWKYLPKHNVVIDGQGIQAMHTENQKPAFEWQVEDARQAYMNGGLDDLESLIEYLEENTGVFSWNTASARGLFINSATTFQEFLDIQERRLVFNRLVPIIKRYEEDQIKANISEDLFDEIKAEILADGAPSSTNALLMRNIQGAIAHYAYADFIIENSIVSDDLGFHIINNALSGAMKSVNPAEQARLRTRQEHHQAIAAGYLKKLSAQLHDNSDDYPLYKASDLYVEDDSTSYQIPNDDPDSGIFTFNP